MRFSARIIINLRLQYLRVKNPWTRALCRRDHLEDSPIYVLSEPTLAPASHQSQFSQQSPPQSFSSLCSKLPKSSPPRPSPALASQPQSQILPTLPANQLNTTTFTRPKSDRILQPDAHERETRFGLACFVCQSFALTCGGGFSSSSSSIY